MQEIDPSKIFERSLKRQLLILAVVLIVSLGILIILWFYGSSETEKINFIRINRSSAVKSLDILSQLSDQSQALESVHPKLKESLTGAFDVVVNIPKRIKELGEKNEVHAQVDIGTQRPAGAEEPSGINLSIKADGSLSNLVNFLKSIESEISFYNFSTIKFSPVSQTGEYQIVLEGKIYIYE